MNVTLKQLWELLWIIVLGVPMMFVGYFTGFVVNGFVTGFLLHRRTHWEGNSTKVRRDQLGQDQ